MTHRPDRYDLTPTFGSEEHAVCRHFGCGVTLSLRESLFGVYCIHHQKQRPAVPGYEIMATKIYGSMSLTDLVEKFKAGHSAFTKSEKNGKIYFNFNEWVNDTPNEHGYHSNYQLQSKKEQREAEGKVYFGNGKISENVGAAVTDADKNAMDLGTDDGSGLPF